VGSVVARLGSEVAGLSGTLDVSLGLVVLVSLSSVSSSMSAGCSDVVAGGAGFGLFGISVVAVFRLFCIGFVRGGFFCIVVVAVFGLFCASVVVVFGLFCIGFVRGGFFCIVVVAVFGLFCGAIFTRHNLAPVCSRSPCRILLPCLSCISSVCLSMYAVQSASHSFPRLKRLLVKPGMMCPVRA